MVALNIMHELHLLQNKSQTPEQEFAEKLVQLREKIENVLQNN
jgi:cell division protein ZapA (FtsZ GTPase activity inhibitor)